MAEVREILKQLDRLPALPDTVVQLLRTVNDKDCEISDIEKIIKKDEALTVAVLRIANSSIYGGKQDGDFDLTRSITRIGAKKIEEIALAHEIGKVMDRAVDSYGLRRGALWEGALAGAISSELIASKTKLVDPGLAFTAGLLRDIGKLAIDVLSSGEILHATLGKAGSDACSLDAERAGFGMDHAELGFALAEHWQLPARLANAIRFHHDPPATPDDADPLYFIVHAGDLLSLWMGRGLGYDGMAYSLSRAAKDALHLSLSTLEGLLAEAQITTSQMLAAS